MRVRSGETSGSPVAKPPCAAEMPGAKRGRASDRSAAKAKPEQASSTAPPRGGNRGSRAVSAAAKATEGASEPEAGTEEPSGVLGVERPHGCPGNWGDPSRPRRHRRREACPPITGDPGKRRVAERESEGAVVVTIAGTTQPGGSEGPLLHPCTQRKDKTLMSADKSARSVSRAEGVEAVRAFQRVLYRAAKSDRY